jgi:hypothetical protein
MVSGEVTQAQQPLQRAQLCLMCHFCHLGITDNWEGACVLILHQWATNHEERKVLQLRDRTASGSGHRVCAQDSSPEGDFVPTPSPPHLAQALPPAPPEGNN